MSKLISILAAILFFQSAPYALADDDIDLEANLTGVWFGLDDSRCYVRQYEQHERQLVSIFCENPYEQSSYVFNGYRLDSGDGRTLEGALSFVPKGTRVSRRNARFRIGRYTKRGKTPSETETMKALYPISTTGSASIDPSFIMPLTRFDDPTYGQQIKESDFGVWQDHFPAPGGKDDLTGVWYGDDGGVYYITERGPFITWFGEHPGGAWSNVAEGARIATRIALNWADVPKGRTRGSGELGLRVDGPNRLIRTSRTGGFGGSVWTRESNERWIQPDPIGSTKPVRTRQVAASLCPSDETRTASEGDREFGGNGPRIVANIELSIEPRMRRSVRATVRFSATETGGDNSSISATWTRTVYIAPENRTIVEILSDTSSSFDFVSAHRAGLEIGMGGDSAATDLYGIASFEHWAVQGLPSSEAVSRLFYIGDTGGSDISSDDDCTRETRLHFIEFNPMQIRLN